MKPGQLCTINKKIYRVTVAKYYASPCVQCDFLDVPEPCYVQVCDRFKIDHNCCLKLIKQ